MVLMRDHTLEMSKLHHQASFMRKILRICTLSGWVLGNRDLNAKPRHFTIRFPEIGTLNAQPQQQIQPTDYECQSKYFVFSHNRAFAASYSRGRKPLCWGVREGRSGTRQTNSSLHWSCNFLCSSSPNACLGLFTIFMDKPFGWQFGQMVYKIQRLVKFVPESRLPFACKLVSFTEKRRRKP